MKTNWLRDAIICLGVVILILCFWAACYAKDCRHRAIALQIEHTQQTGLPTRVVLGHISPGNSYHAEAQGMDSDGNWFYLGRVPFGFFPNGEVFTEVEYRRRVAKQLLREWKFQQGERK